MPKLPTFTNEQEAADWFATHDTAPYMEDMEEVQEPIYVMLDTQQLAELITCDPEIVSGTPVFANTRVPIKNLFDYLKGGHALAEFFEDFPSVGEAQAREVLELAKNSLFVQLVSK